MTPPPQVRGRFAAAVQTVTQSDQDPISLALALLEACREARDEGASTREDAAVRLLASALGRLCSAFPDTQDYPELLASCRAATTGRGDRFGVALDIVYPGACNPSGITHTLVTVCQDLTDTGIAAKADPAIRLIVTQLTWVCGVYADPEQREQLLADCRRFPAGSAR